jgi:hypothetical protein
MTKQEALDGGLRKKLQNAQPADDGTRCIRGNSPSTGLSYRAEMDPEGEVTIWGPASSATPSAGDTDTIEDDTAWNE